MSNAEFIIENGKLTRYNGPSGAVVIPASVKTIGMGAFCFCNDLSSKTTKAQKAKEMGTPIISEEEFLKMAEKQAD